MIRAFKEPVNGLTHLFGAIAALIGLFFLVKPSIQSGDTLRVVSFSIYGISLVSMFTASTLYHSLHLTAEKKKIFRRIDHIAIFLLIAGSFTPFCLVALGNTFGWILFTILWSIAAAGIFMKLFWLNAPRKVSASIYVGMGWLAVIPIYPLSKVLSTQAMIWLMAGGVIYSIGAVVYALKKPDPFPGIFGFHEIWHLFVLAASFAHFWTIYHYLTPAAMLAVKTG